MITPILRLWHGQVALGRAFWEYAVVYGSLANLVTTILAFAVLAAGGAGLLALAVHLLALPYNVAAVVGVWRSAARYRGPAGRADLARAGVVVWAILATLL